MSKFNDLTGHTFGRLTVLRFNGIDKHHTAQWVCRCECGEEKAVAAGSLRSGRTRSCGCLNSEVARGSFSDLTGQQVGRWTVLRRSGSNKSGATWLCVCECGQTQAVSAGNLVNGHSRSCGCFKLESSRARLKKDLSGEQFGKLTVLRRTKSINGKTMWICTCECGTEKRVAGRHLLNGATTSCGCLRREHSGGYNATYFRNNPGSAKRKAILYVVEFVSGQKRFWKVGITVTSVPQRFTSPEYNRFQLRTVHTVGGSLHAMWQLEQAIHTRVDRYREPSTVDFGGHTECFKPEALLDICEYMDDLYPLSPTTYEQEAALGSSGMA